MNSLFPTRVLLPLFAILLLPSLVYAHTGAGHGAGLLHGVGHPIGGLDHLLAMVAVGIWAAQTSGRALWAVPATFITVMVIGGAIGITGMAIPLVEEGIVISVLILGVFIAAALRLPLSASSAIVGLFALFHGYAHGAEMPVALSGLSYGIGFVLTTAVLHISGIFFGLSLQKSARLQTVRYAGAAIAVGGVFLLI
ncbi:MAG: HupE/UreJ family protein [Deltaproteobacteria bacterium]|nr:HupE/UreJ family protein [Deltaproteobacteria bacterium]